MSLLAFYKANIQRQHRALSSLLNAVNANFSGQHVATPDVAAQRTAALLFPKLAAWDNARQTGATALFPGEEARMCDRIELNLFVWMETRALYDADDTKVQSFEERFQYSSNVLQYAQNVQLPGITKMDHEDLLTYSASIAALIKAADMQAMRSSRLSAQLDAS